jgi:dATP pyrophosphohydrolase
VQIIVFAETDKGREYLLLRRVRSHGGFWQSITGSLEESEDHLDAAAREVSEETGIACDRRDLLPLDLVNNFEIAPLWRHKYAPGVSHNEEVCFALRVRLQPVQIDSLEHDAFIWIDYETAMKTVYWESTRRALAAAERILNSVAQPTRDALEELR